MDLDEDDDIRQRAQRLREDWETTLAQVRRMVDRSTHPSWVHAAGLPQGYFPSKYFLNASLTIWV
jgi:hypothetical protein